MNTDEEMVAVPKRMLDELERSRVALYTKFDITSTAEICKMIDITDVMWKLANTKWEPVKCGN